MPYSIKSAVCFAFAFFLFADRVYCTDRAFYEMKLPDSLVYPLSASAKDPEVSEAVLTRQWQAFWIHCAEPNRSSGYGVYHFRKEFTLLERPGHFIIHVSADNRYKLFINGTLVSLGPALGDLQHWSYESVDLAPYLKTGKNILASQVWNEGDYRGVPQFTARTAFIVQGNSENEKVVNTDDSWKCMADSAYSPYTPEVNGFYYLTGPAEKIKYAFYPEGWKDLNYNDHAWRKAGSMIPGIPKGALAWDAGYWMLVHRAIPPIELKPQRLSVVRKMEGIEVDPALPLKAWNLEIPAHKHVSLILDQGFLTNAFPVLKFGRGRNAGISITYAEALHVRNPADPNEEVTSKGNRNKVEGMNFFGKTDTLVADGAAMHEYSPMVYRTYRYIKLEIYTQNEALTIQDFYGIFCGYPFKMNAAFHTEDTLLGKMFEIGWRTARSCAMDTYMDCPYYEQLQYVGDTRIQCLVSLFNSGDDRLMRNAITQIDYSRNSDGVTNSSYPGKHQLIPPFSLWWIGILHDYYTYRSDPEFIRSMLNGSRQILNFFGRYQAKDGSLQNVPYWNFADWCNGKGWNHGMAPVGLKGNSALMDFELLWAYELAADLEGKLGDKSLSLNYLQKAELLKKTIRSSYWSKNRGLYADTPELDKFSQHTNSLAILTGLSGGAEATRMAEKLIQDTSLVQATIYFRYYVNQALVKAGLGNRYLDQLKDWKIQIQHGLTTWAEISDVDHSRSDCHAWGASPNIEFIRTVLGIDADAPGFKHIRIEPHPGKLQNLSGSMPHPDGAIVVSYQKKDQHWEIKIRLPKHTPGIFVWMGKTYPLKNGADNAFTL